jgi:hypothetical protein
MTWFSKAGNFIKKEAQHVIPPKTILGKAINKVTKVAVVGTGLGLDVASFGLTHKASVAAEKKITGGNSYIDKIEKVTTPAVKMIGPAVANFFVPGSGTDVAKMIGIGSAVDANISNHKISDQTQQALNVAVDNKKTNPIIMYIGIGLAIIVIIFHKKLKLW